MTDVEVFVDPSCPWAWITARWVREVAPERDLTVLWRSYCLEIRDDYGVAPTVPDAYRQVALEGHALSHRMLRIFEAARAEHGEDAVDRLYSEWGRRYFPKRQDPENFLATCVAAAGLDARLTSAANEEKWDAPIRDAMAVAYAFGGPKTQTPTIVVRAKPPHGFKGPVMAPAPSGPPALQLWDAIQVLAAHQGFFEITRPRANLPRDHIPEMP
jgi:predicted DsbA family dithiol-disulfide isomerase